MRRLMIFAAVLAIALPLVATEPNPSARQKELVEKLLVAMNVDKMTASVVDSMYEQIGNQYLQEAQAKGNEPDDIAEAKEMFASFREHARQINFAALLHDEQVRMYARYFTEEELTDLNTFYASKTGKKMIEVLPRLMSDGMKEGIDKVTPKITELMNQVTEEQEHKRPWRRTMADMRALSTAIEAYQTDQSDETFPAASDLAGLKEQLKGITMSQKFPEKDMWGHPYEYVVSPDRHHYRIVSAGADGIFEWDSRKLENVKEGQPTRYRDRLEDDLIFEDGVPVQLPVQLKPKAKKQE